LYGTYTFKSRGWILTALIHLRTVGASADLRLLRQTGDISHKPSSRLPILSARPAVAFPALGWYQFILLGE